MMVGDRLPKVSERSACSGDRQGRSVQTGWEAAGGGGDHCTWHFSCIGSILHTSKITFLGAEYRYPVTILQSYSHLFRTAILVLAYVRALNSSRVGNIAHRYLSKYRFFSIVKISNRSWKSV